MKVDILDIQGSSTGRSIDLPDDIFGIEPNEHVVYLAVKQYLARQHLGTHKAKERGEIKGSTRKIKKQKGTGTARAGSIKNPLFRGGGRVFGPRPRKYNVKLNKKVKTLARKSVLSEKLKDNNIVIVEDFTFDKPKTSQYVDILNNLDVAGVRSLVVTSGTDKNLYLSSRNVFGAEMMEAKEVHPYALMKAKKVVLSESAVQDLTEILK